MKRIDLTITAKAPLAIGQRKPGDSVSEAMDYIPGSVIRGAIAGKILQQSAEAPTPGDDFHALFVDEPAAIFGNGYPAIAKVGEDRYQFIDSEVQLLPTTALSSKTDSGFKPSKAGVFDSLIDSYCAREHGLFYEPNDLSGGRVEPFDGFYSRREDGSYVSHSINKRLLTRVGINRRRATAQDQLLYSIEVLNEFQGKETPVPTAFKGAIWIENEGLADQLLTFIQANRHRFRLGGSASRGLGKVQIEATMQDDATPTEAVSQRVHEFNQKLQERWQHWNAFGKPSPNPIQERTFFTLNLQSDAVLIENWQRTMVVSETMLQQFTGLSSKVKLEMAYSSYAYRSGWNAAWGLAKDVELVTNMGSVFLFSIPQADQATWSAALAALENRGIGERTSEGFGQVTVCDEFHQVMREDSV